MIINATLDDTLRVRFRNDEVIEMELRYLPVWLLVLARHGDEVAVINEEKLEEATR